MIEIIFGKSSSKSYPRAVALAKKCSSYSESGGEHRVTWDTKDADHLIPLYNLIAGWRGARVIIDGREVQRPSLLTSWIACYMEGKDCRRISTAYRGPWHPFGCKQSRELSFWTYSPWLRIGELRGRSWVFDKEAIHRFAMNEMRDLRLCPRQDPLWPRKMLDVFPVAINPDTDRLWIYQTAEGLERIRSVMIMLGTREDIQDERIIGVGPRGEFAADEIMEQLLTMISIKETA
jgi:hypothetical protein